MLNIPPITTAIMVVTIITSIMAFNNTELKYKLVFSPYDMKRRGQWYRAFTSGLIHADWMHLIFNMYVLYGFGATTELLYMGYFGAKGTLLYSLLYVLGIILSEAYSYFKYQDDYSYSSLGASGAVSAVVFSFILFAPMVPIGFPFLPKNLWPPGFIMGILYLVYSQYKAQKADDHIGHNAHFYGAIFGFVFPLIFQPSLFLNCIEMIKLSFSK